MNLLEHIKLPPYEELNENFLYDSKTGLLFWKKRGLSRKVGVSLGSVNAGGYLRVAYKRKLYYVHRIAWYLANGFDPGDLQIDHINGNKIDNRINNLRLATRSQNAFNSPLRKNNTSGIKGVTWSKHAKAWKAEIREGKTQKHLGYFKRKSDAEQCVKEYREALHKEFTNHG